MSKALGVGVRVYIGWVPADECSAGAVCCVCGTIIDGPYPPDATIEEGSYFRVVNRTAETIWGVQTDDGPYCQCVESVLTPIDDDGETATEQQEAEAHG